VDVAIITQTEHLLDAILSHVNFEKKFLISKEPDFLEQFQKTREYYAVESKKAEALLDTAKKKILFSEIGKLYQHYLALFDEEAAFVTEGKDYPRLKYSEEKEKILDDINQKLAKIIALARGDRDQKIMASYRASYRILRVSVATAGLTIIVGILISFLNTRVINRSITLLKKKTKEIASGSFIEIRDINSPPEIKALADDFNTMSDRLRELDKMKADFISHISHELRTPLTAIKEASGMLLDGVIVDSPEKQKDLLIIIKEECDRLIERVNKILDLSRMEARMMQYQFVEANLAPVIQRAVLKLAPIAYGKRIDLELRPLPRLPALRFDEERIGQVLENLLSNGLKFTPEGGRVTVKASLHRNKAPFIRVAVRDNGPGISKENLEKIFERFRRIESGRETPRGTGLGLSIAKHVIAEHGGKIWAESQPGKGSIFYFTLPVS